MAHFLAAGAKNCLYTNTRRLEQKVLNNICATGRILHAPLCNNLYILYNILFSLELPAACMQRINSCKRSARAPFALPIRIWRGIGLVEQVHAVAHAAIGARRELTHTQLNNTASHNAREAR